MSMSFEHALRTDNEVFKAPAFSSEASDYCVPSVVDVRLIARQAGRTKTGEVTVNAC
jgi:hypothetical protein